jgi:hypothetical protein
MTLNTDQVTPTDLHEKHSDDTLVNFELDVQKELEVQKHAEWIHKIYSSRRYRLGHALIKPIEGFLLKIRLIQKNNDSNSHDRASNNG